MIFVTVIIVKLVYIKIYAKSHNLIAVHYITT